MDDRVTEFRRLHEAGCFLMPNPWDVGSAKALEKLGFKALATTSAGFAWTLGQPDNGITLEESLSHFQSIADAVGVPINADFEGAFAVEPDQVYAHVRTAVGTGIAGVSVEDSTGDRDQPLYDFDLAVERVRAARRAIDDSGTGVVLTGRSEGFVVGRPDIAETVRRIEAYGEAGADCLYAPRIERVADIEAVVAAAGTKPVNLLVNAPFITMDQAADLGVRRISVGGTLARTAWKAMLDAATEFAESGTFSHFQNLPNVDGLLSG